MSVRRIGNWGAARRLLGTAPARLKVGVQTALRQEAQLLRKEIVTGLTRQAPGGESLRAPSPLTLAARQLRGFGGTKALIVRADLRNAVTALVKQDRAFVGVPRKARGRDGKPVVDVAKLNEFGSDPIVIPITPAMRRFLFALRRHAGLADGGGDGGGGGAVVIQIPPRPFLRPAFQKFRRGAERRFLSRVRAVMRPRGR